MVSYVLAKRIIGSRLGLVLRALSDDQLAAASAAVQVSRAKVTALALSAAWAGAGGFLYAHYVRYIHPDMFGLEPSVLFLVMSMFGGYRSIEGMILATAVLESATELMMRHGPAFGHLLGVADMVVHGAVEVALVGRVGSPDFEALARAVAAQYVPSLALAGGPPEGSDGIELLAGREMRNSAATAYVCRQFTCDAPVTEPAELITQLEGASRAR